MRAPHAPLHTHLPYPNPHRQRIDEQSQRPCRSHPALHPPQQHRPEDHLLTPRDPPQHLRPRHVAQACHAHSHPPRPLPQLFRQSRFQLHPPVLDATSVSLRPHHPKRRRRLLHLPHHLPEERLVLLLLHPQPRLRHKVPERHWLWQPLHFSRQVRLRLQHHVFQRHVVDRQVMAQPQQQPSIPARIPCRHATHQR